MDQERKDHEERGKKRGVKSKHTKGEETSPSPDSSHNKSHEKSPPSSSQSAKEGSKKLSASDMKLEGKRVGKKGNDNGNARTSSLTQHAKISSATGNMGLEKTPPGNPSAFQAAQAEEVLRYERYRAHLEAKGSFARHASSPQLRTIHSSPTLISKMNPYGDQVHAMLKDQQSHHQAHMQQVQMAMKSSLSSQDKGKVITVTTTWTDDTGYRTQTTTTRMMVDSSLPPQSAPGEATMGIQHPEKFLTSSHRSGCLPTQASDSSSKNKSGVAAETAARSTIPTLKLSVDTSAPLHSPLATKPKASLNAVRGSSGMSSPLSEKGREGSVSLVPPTAGVQGGTAGVRSVPHSPVSTRKPRSVSPVGGSAFFPASSPRSVPGHQHQEDHLYVEDGSYADPLHLYASSESTEPITLNVGGELFTCARSTLLATPSMLSAMFSGRHTVLPNRRGEYFLDRDPTHFRFILNYLRDPSTAHLHFDVMTTRELRELEREASFFQVENLLKEVGAHLNKRARREWCHPWLKLSGNDLVITKRKSAANNKVWCLAGVGKPISPSLGLYYCEILVRYTSERQIMVGLMPLRPRKLHAVHIGKIPGGIGYHCNGHLYREHTCASFGPTWGNGDCIGTLVDMEAHQMYWYVNGEPTKLVKLDPDMDGYVFTICLFTIDDSVELLPNINLPSLPSWKTNEDLARQGTPLSPLLTPGSP